MQEAEREQEVRPGYKTSKPSPDDLLPPARSRLLKITWSFKMGAPPTGEYMNARGTLLIQASTLNLSDVKCLEKKATGKSGPQGPGMNVEIVHYTSLSTATQEVQTHQPYCVVFSPC